MAYKKGEKPTLPYRFINRYSFDLRSNKRLMFVVEGKIVFGEVVKPEILDRCFEGLQKFHAVAESHNFEFNEFALEMSTERKV